MRGLEKEITCSDFLVFIVIVVVVLNLSAYNGEKLCAYRKMRGGEGIVYDSVNVK